MKHVKLYCIIFLIDLQKQPSSATSAVPKRSWQILESLGNDCQFSANKLLWLGFENSPFVNETSDFLEKVERVPFTLSSSHIWSTCSGPGWHSRLPSTSCLCQNCTACKTTGAFQKHWTELQLHSCQTDSPRSTKSAQAQTNIFLSANFIQKY